ncbi:hypothetical protein HMPREF1544_05518 [Mucor circinelloides 1006PhL]|uniref:Uncharacterized protein n=1 Tax=Mucor circinelloides f. circinelloides (strain 1006PhL) TaxID=1220926 RepID=S2K5Z2_MUCC1|nr:hypothetical protein HMPREF1544_05518 [Mucor circinelloides 1006PhL]
MPGSPIPPNLNPALPDATGTAHSLEAPSSDWTSTMRTPGPATVPTATISNKRRRNSMQQDIAGRDYYNNLKQSELIDLVVKLQEKNLILTRLLERSTLTATATTATTTVTSSNNRLNLNPVVNFTRTKSGSAASPYASEKDFFPALNSGTKKGSAAIATKATTTTTATKSTTANVPKKKSGNQKSSKPKHSQPPADAAEAKKMGSTPPIKLLSLLKINLKRIFAIQRPAKNVVFLLVHSNYASETVQICKTDVVNAITDFFNPISGKNLGDHKLVNDLTDAQLTDKAKVIYYNRMLQAAVQLRDPRLGLTIFKFFNAQDQSSDNHYIPSVIIDEYIKLKPADSVRKICAANTARSVLKGFDASQLFASLANTNVDTSIPTPASGSNSSSSSTDASNAGNSAMDLN